MPEPGIDEHDWASRYASLEEDVRDAPVEALTELDQLVAEMMDARGLPLEERDGETTSEPETVRQFAEARRVKNVLETGDPYDPGDVANAVDAYRSLYDYLLHIRSEPGLA
jgi:hypothetical protein